MVFLPHNSLPNVVLNEVYSFSIKSSIPSIDRQSDCDAIYVSKMKNLRNTNIL